MKKILFAIAFLFFPLVSFAWTDAVYDTQNFYSVTITEDGEDWDYIKYATGTAVIGYGDTYYYSTTSSSLSDEILASLYPLTGTSSPWTHQTNGSFVEPFNLTTSYGNCADSIQVELFVEASGWPSVPTGKYQMVICDHGEWSTMYEYTGKQLSDFLYYTTNSSNPIRIESPSDLYQYSAGIDSMIIEIEYLSAAVAGARLLSVEVVDTCGTLDQDNEIQMNSQRYYATTSIDNVSTVVQTHFQNVSFTDIGEDDMYTVEACIESIFGEKICDSITVSVGAGKSSCVSPYSLYGFVISQWEMVKYKAPWGYLFYAKDVVTDLSVNDESYGDIILPFGDMSVMALQDVGSLKIWDWDWIPDSELYDEYLLVDDILQKFLWIGFLLFMLRIIWKGLPSVSRDEAQIEINRNVPIRSVSEKNRSIRL